MATRDDLCYECAKPLGDDAPNAVIANERVRQTFDQTGPIDVPGNEVVLHPACHAANPDSYIPG